ncbi:MAG: hypothetical protein J7647_16500 [Cyanobacteria bacterium SBLK]|nr:hypothetical protein [Cyanobacteria bacterium SBLK]
MSDTTRQYMSDYDVVVEYLKNNTPNSPLVQVTEPDNLNTRYLFSHEQLNQPTEYTVVTEFLRNNISSNEENPKSIT